MYSSNAEIQVQNTEHMDFREQPQITNDKHWTFEAKCLTLGQTVTLPMRHSKLVKNPCNPNSATNSRIQTTFALHIKQTRVITIFLNGPLWRLKENPEGLGTLLVVNCLPSMHCAQGSPPALRKQIQGWRVSSANRVWLACKWPWIQIPEL